MHLLPCGFAFMRVCIAVLLAQSAQLVPEQVPTPPSLPADGTSRCGCTRPATRARCRPCRWTAALSACTWCQWRSSGAGWGWAGRQDGWGGVAAACPAGQSRGPCSLRSCDLPSPRQHDMVHLPGPAGPKRTMRCSCGPWRPHVPKRPPCTMQRGTRSWRHGSSWCEGGEYGMHMAAFGVQLVSGIAEASEKPHGVRGRVCATANHSASC